MVLQTLGCIVLLSAKTIQAFLWFLLQYTVIYNKREYYFVQEILAEKSSTTILYMR